MTQYQVTVNAKPANKSPDTVTGVVSVFRLSIVSHLLYALEHIPSFRSAKSKHETCALPAGHLPEQLA